MRLRLLTLAVLVSTACVDDAPAPDGSDLPTLEPGAVRVNILVEPGSGDTQLIRLLLDTEELHLGAYQGRFTFDPQQLTLRAATTPEDNFRLVNTANAARGEIRFAGFAVTAFDSPVVLELHMAATAGFDPHTLHAELEVVGDILGTQVGRAAIAPPTLMIAR